jgi:hypothetical protein
LESHAPPWTDRSPEGATQANYDDCTIPLWPVAGQPVQFVLNGNGDFTPGHVAGSTSVFVVQSFNVTFEFTPTEGEAMSETAARSKSNPHGDLVTCTFDVTQSAPDGTFHFVGTATGFFTPAS